MSDIDMMLRHPAFNHRNKTKRQIQLESHDRLKHSMINIDVFTHVRNHLVNIGTDGVYKYKLSYSKRQIVADFMIPNITYLAFECLREINLLEWHDRN